MTACVVNVENAVRGGSFKSLLLGPRFRFANDQTKRVTAHDNHFVTGLGKA